MKAKLGAILVACAVAAFAGTSSAQEFPSRPIRFVVSFPAGGGVDIMGRLVANVVSQRVGQPVVVENRTGASGVVGSAAVANAAPDGYSVLVTGDIPITQAHLLNKIPYDPYKDLIHLVKGVNVPTSVLVAGNAPFRSLGELLDFARANPGKVSWGTPGNGTAMHVELEMLKEKLGLNIVHVPYKGAPPIIADTMGGQITVGAPGLPPTIGNIKSGKLRLLAVWGPSRVGVFPEVPTVQEVTGDASLQGIPTWYGFLLPAGVPKPIQVRLEAEIIAGLKDPEVSRKLTEAGATVVAQASAAFAEANRAQTGAFAAIFKKLNLKAE
jgi:tripartite-type tricarboxylate transporter receptor subunit TctC